MHKLEIISSLLNQVQILNSLTKSQGCTIRVILENVQLFLSANRKAFKQNFSGKVDKTNALKTERQCKVKKIGKLEEIFSILGIEIFLTIHSIKISKNKDIFWPKSDLHVLIGLRPAVDIWSKISKILQVFTVFAILQSNLTSSKRTILLANREYHSFYDYRPYLHHLNESRCRFWKTN